MGSQPIIYISKLIIMRKVGNFFDIPFTNNYCTNKREFGCLLQNSPVFRPLKHIFHILNACLHQDTFKWEFLNKAKRFLILNFTYLSQWLGNINWKLFHWRTEIWSRECWGNFRWLKGYDFISCRWINLCFLWFSRLFWIMPSFCASLEINDPNDSNNNIETLKQGRVGKGCLGPWKDLLRTKVCAI